MSRPNRRERLRAETSTEITRTARELLVRDGPDGLTLRAIARALGMTAPALYRYYASHDVLLNHVIADIYDELASELRDARDAVDDPLVQLLEVARRFRRWALEHPQEFALVFVNPIRITRNDGNGDNPADAAGLRFAAVFAESLATLYERKPFRVPDDDEIDPALRRQLIAWRKRFPIDLPIGALLVFLTGWIRIYGTVCMEVFGHLRFAVDDGAAMYEHEIQVLAEMLRPRPQRGRKTTRSS
jgi:AcrR family transcriptional regulator